MTDLVTGGAGFIGRHLVEQLANKGRTVRVLDLDTSGQWPAGVEKVRGSITDRAAVALAMEDIEHVYHLAAIPQLWHSDPKAFLEVNAEGAKIVGGIAAQMKVKRFIHCSSEVVFIDPRGPRVPLKTIDESVRPPLSAMAGPYCRSKWWAEHLLEILRKQRLPLIIVNPSAPLGPGDRSITPPTQLLSDLIYGRLPAYLETHLNFVDVRDAAAGHILAAEKGRLGERYLLNGHGIWLSALIAKISGMTGVQGPKRRVPYWLAETVARVEEGFVSRLTGKPPTALLTGVRLARRALMLSSDKAKEELGWAPRDFDETLRDTVAALTA